MKKKPTLPPEKNFKKKKIPQIIFILSFCLANNGVFNNDNNNTIKEIIITIRKMKKKITEIQNPPKDSHFS